MPRLPNAPLSILSRPTQTLPHRSHRRNRVLPIPAFGFILLAVLISPGLSRAHDEDHDGAVRPILECVTPMADGSYSALFGFKNENAFTVKIPVGSNNKFSPSPVNRGQTTAFKPGRIIGAFRVSFNGSNLVWTLEGPDDDRRTATASSKSTRCANQAPHAANDTAGTVQGVSVRVQVLANDSDPEGTALTVAAVGTPGHGSTVINADNTVAYYPVSTFSGTDTFSYTARDAGGATGTATVTVTVTADTTPPTITPTAAPTPNANGWNNADVTVSFTCSDSGSGVANCPASITVVTQGTNQLASGTASDLAGNTATAHMAVNIDKTQPLITITSPQNEAVLNVSKPGISVLFSDEISDMDASTVHLSLDGLDVTSDALITASGLTYTPKTTLADGSHSVLVSATDKANNTGSSSATFTTKTRTRPFIFPEPGFDAGSYKDSNSAYNGPMKVSDINKDGIPDVVLVNNGGSGFGHSSKISVILGKGDGGFQNPVSFGELSGAPDTGYDDIVAEDFNSDAIPDLALTVSLSNNRHELLLFTGNGDGTFTTGPSYTLNAPGRILTGMFDADSYVDTAIADQNGAVRLFYGMGDGSFSNPVMVWSADAGSGLTEAVASDFNHDGLADIGLILGDGSGGHELLVLLNKDNGAFQSSTVLPWDDSVYLSNLTVGDLNGDGFPDIFMMKDNPYSLRPDLIVFINDGSGNFQEPRVDSPGLVIPSNNYSLLGGRTVEFTDLNGDRKLDLLIAYLGTAFTFLGNGDGTFQPPSEFSTDGGSMNIGDFDQDGAQDIITVGSFDIFMLFGRGDGGFIDRVEIPTTEAIFGIVSADLDGDHTPDLVLSGNGFVSLFSTVLNRGNTWIGNDISPPFQVDRTYRTGIDPVAVKRGDLNKDGHPDLVVANDLSNDVSVLLNSGNGDLNAPVSYPVGSAPAFIALEDLNGDGNPDIVTVNSGSNDVSILLGNGDGSFQAQKIFTAGPNPKSLAIADVNGDGHPDIVATDYDPSVNYVSILLGNGDGTFQPYYPWNTIGRFPIAIQTGDFNRDGLADFAVVNYLYYSSYGFQASMVTLLLGKGDGSFDEKIAYQSSNVFVFDAILSEDLNGDGKQDFIVFDYAASSAWVFLNDGYGQLDEMIPVGGLEGLLLYGGLSATLDDLNHDGHLDLLVGGGSSLQVWLGQGDGTFARSSSIGGWEDVASVEMADLNGDGVPDIALVDHNNLSLIPGKGNGTFAGQAIINQEAGVSEISGMASADFNGDRNQDIVLSDAFYNPTGGTHGYPRIELYWGTGDNTFRRGPTLQTSTLPNRGIVAADINQDGLVDIVLAQDPGVMVYINNGDETFRAPISYTISTRSVGIRVADINQDNRLDIVSLDSTPISGHPGEFSSSLSIHTGNGDGTFQPNGTILLDPFEPSDLLVRDFNGDGYPDLAVGMNLGHTLRIYLNNGNGTFNDPMSYEVGVEQGTLIAQDFNQDGFMDLVVGDLESINLLLGNGNGTFQPPAAYGSNGQMVSTDFNLDGRMDIAVGSGGTVKLLLNQLPALYTPPSPPQNLSGAAGDGSVSLIWAESPEADLAGYNLYRSLYSGGGYTKINGAPITSLSYIDTSVTNGQLYFYTVAAVNTQGEESSLSSKIKLTPHPADTAAPLIKITIPLNGGITVDPLLFVSGTVDDVGAVVTVNGQSAAVQTQSGTFTANNIPLNPGMNTVAATAVDSAGNRSSDTVTVTYALVAGMTGTIQDAATGEPVSGATVSVQDAGGIQTVTTGLDGLYMFLRLVPGEVTLTVTPSVNIYQTTTLTKTLSPGLVMTLNIPLDLRPAILTGTVYDSFPVVDNPKPFLRVYNPIAGATVSVTDGKKTQAVVTDVSGKYRVENITPYEITVTVAKAGYETFIQDQFISPGQTEGIDYLLDKLPPAAPTGLVAAPIIRGAALKWNPNTESDLLGYNVYRATTSGGDYSLLNTAPVTSPSYMAGGLAGGTTYYYVVTAINTSGSESGYSAEVSATTPSPTLPISITSPANGTNVNASSVIITGTVDATLNEIGVVIEVNGPDGIESVPAHVNRNSFSAMVPLQAETNVITAVAVNPGGAYGEASITVDASIPSQDVLLIANPESGVPDSTTGLFSVTLRVETTLTNPVSQYRWDLDGNGVIDQVGATLTKVTAQYQAVGIYYPTVSVTDTKGNTYTAATIVNVLSRDELDALLKSKWEGMKTALINGDIEGAIGYFAESSQERYRGIFNAVQSQLSDMVAGMNTIQFIHADNGIAKFRIRRQEAAGEITYYIFFVMDQDGIWRIQQF